MSAEPSASMWEVTRLILENPGTSPSAIAHAHGYSAAEVAELLPIFLDNLRADFAGADGAAPELVPPTPNPGETAEEHAERYLHELAAGEHLDVVGYDTLSDLDSSGGLQNGDVAAVEAVRGNDPGTPYEDPTFLDGTEGEPDPPAPDEPSGEATAFDGGRATPEPGDEPDPDRPDVDDPLDLAEDDPFASLNRDATPDPAHEADLGDAPDGADGSVETFDGD